MERIDTSRVNRIKLDSVNKMIDMARKYPFVKRLVIFGSSVTDYCTEESDIDVCADVDCPDRERDLHNLHVELCKTCDANCDILIYRRLNGQIKGEVDKKGVIVYAA